MESSVKKEFPVVGMSCASCAANVERVIRGTSGVKNASVNFAAGRLMVDYFPNQIHERQLQAVLQDVGYDLLIQDETRQQEVLDEIKSKTYSRLKKKAVAAIILSVPIVILGMFSLNIPHTDILMWGLSTLIVFVLGSDFFVNAIKQAQHGVTTMDTLVALSTGVAYVFSIFILFFSEKLQQKGLPTHTYFEASAVIVSFVLLGRLWEEKAKDRTSLALKKLMGLQPKTVTVTDAEGNDRVIPVEEVRKEDLVRVKPGEKIAVDGVVISGSSYVDESMLSGEPVAVLKSENAKVFAGTINQGGSFLFRATQVGKDTILSQIIQSVQQAQSSKAPVQKLADKVAGVFVPSVMVISLITFILWWIFGGNSYLVQGFVSAVTVLVIACPCALGLATPTAIMVGVGKAAESGILIKDAESLESANRLNTIVLDKTGTLTEGKPEVISVHWERPEENFKSVLVSMEKLSEHPLAAAVVKYFDEVKSVELTCFESFTGKGIKAVYQNETYFVGNATFIAENHISVLPQIQDVIKQSHRENQTVIIFADTQEVLAVIAVSDKIKPTSSEAVQQLQKMGVELYMLTGDTEVAAKSVADKVGITHYKSGVLPQEKADFIRQLQQQGKVVAMVGDGINDSTALALADISIAMGKGSDIAMDVAKMTIISSDLMKIPQAIQISRQTLKTIRQNLFWAFVYNIMGIPIAAGLLYPVNGFLLNPMIASAAMALSSISVVINSLCLRWR